MRGIRGPTGCRETRRMMAAAMSEGGHRREGGEMLLLLLLTGICVSMAIMPMPSAVTQPKSATGSCDSAGSGSWAPLRIHLIITLIMWREEEVKEGNETREAAAAHNSNREPPHDAPHLNGSARSNALTPANKSRNV